MPQHALMLRDFSPETREGLRLWAAHLWGDEQILHTTDEVNAGWSWIWFLLREAEDRPEWFPHGKWATIQYLETRLNDRVKEEYARRPSGEQ